MKYILDFFQTTFSDEFQTTMTGDRIASGLLVAFFVSLFIIWIYRITYQGVVFSRSFCFSLVLLSMVTGMIIMTVTTNLTLSLGMVGALSIVRFRTAVKEPSDTVFMFWAISAGIMAGAGLIYIALITNISLGLIYLLMFWIAKKTQSAPYLLILRYQEEKKEEVETALKNLKYMKIKSRTVSRGTIELAVQTRFTAANLSLVDTFSSMDGVLDASAVSYNGETTF